MAMVWMAAVALALLAGAAYWLTQPVGRAPLEGPRVKADPQRLEAHVRTLSESFGPRSHLHAENLSKVADHLAAGFRDAGGVVHEQRWEVGGRAYRNVLARFGPETNTPVILGAHYDVDGPHPGADDNASGVAGLLELARLFGEQPPPFEVVLAAYALEEEPHFRTNAQGSWAHAESLARRGAKVRGMLSVEMIGFFSDAPGSQALPFALLEPLYTDRGDFIAVVGNLTQVGIVRQIKRAMRSASPLPVRSINAPAALEGIDFSDHMPFWHFGFDAVMVTDTAFNRNPHYHRATDTWQTLDYRRMAQVVEALHAAAYALGR